MADVEIHIEGIPDVQRALAEMDEKVRVKAMKSALLAAGNVMADAVEERAPVKVEPGGLLPDGALKSDLGVLVTQADGQLAAVVRFGKLTYFVARWVEYGHRLVKGGYSSMKRGKLRGSGHQVGEVPAHPFIRPAFEATARASFDAFVQKLGEELKGKK